MATRTAFEMSQAVALSVAYDVLNAYVAGVGVDVPSDQVMQAAQVIAHMRDQKAKPRAKSNAPTKGQLVNLGLAKRVAQFIWDMPEGELVTSKLVMTSAGIPEIASTQKATSLLGIAADNGWVVRKEVKSRVYWSAGDVDPRA